MHAFEVPRAVRAESACNKCGILLLVKGGSQADYITEYILSGQGRSLFIRIVWGKILTAFPSIPKGPKMEDE